MDSDRYGVIADLATDGEGQDPASGDDAEAANADEEEEQRQQQELVGDEAEIPLLMLDSAALQSKVDGGRNYFSDAPPPSPEKSRRRRHRRAHPDADDDARVSEDLRRRSGLELEVEELLDNSTQWRKSHQARIRTPVRRAVLAYGGASPGRRQQVLCDLNAKVRELEVAALSRGIAYSLQATAAGQQHRQHQPGRQNEIDAQTQGTSTDPAGSISKLDPRVRVAYQQILPRQTGVQDAAVSRAQQFTSSWQYTGGPRLQSRGRSVRSRAAAGLSREATNVTATDSTGSTDTAAGYRSRRAKTSLTSTTTISAGTNSWSTSVTKADLLRLQTINGEVQRSLYTERVPGLRRLLHAGGGGDGGVGVCGITGIGGSRILQAAPAVASLLQARSSTSTGGSVCPPATATGARRMIATAAK